MKLKNILVLLLTCICVSNAYAQKISKHYVSRPQENGTLYFILPMELFEQKKNGALVMDFTSNNSQNETVINYSATQPDIIPIDSVIFTYGRERKAYATRKIFVEASKKEDWLHRYTLTLPTEDVAEIFNPANKNIAMSLINNTGTPVVYKAKSSDWSSNTEIIQKILKMIRHNTD